MTCSHIDTTDLDAEVQRLMAENGHLRRALEYGNDTYVLAMAADRDRWKRRAERWKEAARVYRRMAYDMGPSCWPYWRESLHRAAGKEMPR